jgi:glyoxylase-like metal-dependent hydrolase (beta-lactamase superfamily II)
VEPVIEVFTVAPFEENTYLVGDADAGDAVVVDPGGRVEDIVRIAELRGLRVTAVVGTHTHIDHVAGVEALRRLTGAPYWVHPDAESMLAALPQQAAMFGLPPVEAPHVDGHLQPEIPLRVGAMELEVRHTPGHAPGHVSLIGPRMAWEGALRPFALVGDVIFLGSIGRTDLPGGDYATLMRSIEQQILTLPDETLLLSGHGPVTTVGHERRTNAFVADWLGRGAGR